MSGRLATSPDGNPAGSGLSADLASAIGLPDSGGARLVLATPGAQSASFTLHWLSAPEWNALIEDAGLVAEELYGWFDRRPYEGGEDQIWVCRRPG